MNGQDLASKLEMHRQAIALLPGETVLRRYAVLQALAGQNQDALDTMARLKIFATELHDWPTQLASVFKSVDEQGKPLAAFKAELVKLYGLPASPQPDDSDDDDGDD
jgi:hypothetical protein